MHNEGMRAVTALHLLGGPSASRGLRSALHGDRSMEAGPRGGVWVGSRSCHGQEVWAVLQGMDSVIPPANHQGFA